MVGAQFGSGGGGEVQAAVAKLAIQEKYGVVDGEKVWKSLRGENDPETVRTLHDGQSFPYGKTPANPQGTAMPDKGSVTDQQLVFDKTGSAVTSAEAKTKATVEQRTSKDTTAALGGAPTTQDGKPNLELAKGIFNDGVLPGDMLENKHGMSNALVVSGANTHSGHPVAVFGPQTGYFAPQLLMLQELQGPGISARGASFAGHQLLRAARPRPGLLVERDHRGPGHHRHLRGRPVRPERRTGDQGVELLPLRRQVRRDADRGAQELLVPVGGAARSRTARTRCGRTGRSTARSPTAPPSAVNRSRSRSCGRPTCTS